MAKVTKSDLKLRKEAEKSDLKLRKAQKIISNLERRLKKFEGFGGESEGVTVRT